MFEEIDALLCAAGDLMTHQVLNSNSFTIDFNVAYDIIESYIVRFSHSMHQKLQTSIPKVKNLNIYSKIFENEIEQLETQNSKSKKYHCR